MSNHILCSRRLIPLGLQDRWWLLFSQVKKSVFKIPIVLKWFPPTVQGEWLLQRYKVTSWTLSKDQRFLFEDTRKCKGEKVFAPMRKGSSCWTNVLRLLYEIKIRSSSVLQIWLGSLRELHYLSDLVRLLASRCIEQEDAVCFGGWCSEFRCAVGRRRRGQEDESVTWAGLSQLWKLVTWRKKVFFFSITEGTGVQEGWGRNRSGSCCHYLLHPWSRKHMRASSGLDHLRKAERANSGRSERIELGDGELTEHWISCSSNQSSFFESCNKSQEIGISDVMQWFDFVT